MGPRRLGRELVLEVEVGGELGDLLLQLRFSRAETRGQRRVWGCRVRGFLLEVGDFLRVGLGGGLQLGDLFGEESVGGLEVVGAGF